MAYQVVPLSMFLASGEPIPRLGSAAPYAAPNEAFPTQDGHIMVAAYTPKRWAALCDALGRPDLETDDRFETNEKRVRARPELFDALAPLFRQRTTEEWIEALDAADILCGPILDYQRLVREEQVANNGSLVTVSHPAIGDVRAPTFPGRLSDTGCDSSGPPPPVAGEHSREILSENGFEQSEIEALIAGLSQPQKSKSNVKNASGSGKLKRLMCRNRGNLSPLCRTATIRRSKCRRARSARSR